MILNNKEYNEFMMTIKFQDSISNQDTSLKCNKLLRINNQLRISALLMN